ncbi:murein L,D-transpeptidase catalytic domain family protein [Sphingobacterium rhinopitheci]|nr:murein L,D-transpeptidase catalytic domain family protein [Sphingobacterium rhinopitheci]
MPKSTVNPVKESKPTEVVSVAKSLYKDLNLEGILKFDVFEKAYNGYVYLKPQFRNSDIITVIDFSLPSTSKRMYVIDITQKKLLYHTIVSHGKNSGELYATNFSNRHGSLQSSLGFFMTENTYQGSNGYSLVLNGLEKNINDQAKARAVVIHGADYCNQRVIQNLGRLGRSYGCPALPRDLNAPIINTIKNGTMLFIYAEDKGYLASSKVLNSIEPTMLAQGAEVDDLHQQAAVMD